MKWIDTKKRKPEGEIFWALTEGGNEGGERDWVIRKIINDELGDYRTLDDASSYNLPGKYNGQSWYTTIFAWLPLSDINVRDEEFN